MSESTNAVVGIIVWGGANFKVRVSVEFLIQDTARWAKSIEGRAQAFERSITLDAMNSTEYQQAIMDLLLDCELLRKRCLMEPLVVDEQNYSNYIDSLLDKCEDAERGEKSQFFLDTSTGYIIIDAESFPAIRIEDFLVSQMRVLIKKSWLRKTHADFEF